MLKQQFLRFYFAIIILMMVVVLSHAHEREIATLTCGGYLRGLIGSIFETKIDLSIPYSSVNFAFQKAKERVKECRCPNISERNFMRQYVPSVEGFLWNSMPYRNELDDTCGAQTDAPNNWMQMSNRMHFASVSTCNLNDVANNGKPCLFSVAVGKMQIQVALDSCPADATTVRHSFNIPQRLPYISINCKGDECENIGVPCNSNSDCGGTSLSCWDITNLSAERNFQWGHYLSIAGIFNQFDTCKTPEQLIDGLMKAMLFNHWGKTGSTKTYDSIKFCGPKLNDMMNIGTASVSCKDSGNTKQYQRNADFSSVSSKSASSSVLSAREAARDTSQQTTYFCGGTESTSENVCNGNGRCVLITGNIGVCRCSYGFAGSLCDQRVKCGEEDSASASVCSGNGRCESFGNHPSGVCKCNSGYTGSNCDQTLKCPDCQNFGDCVASTGTIGKCSCRNGFTGSRCEKPVTCNGIENFSYSQVCSGRGNCVFATPNYEDASTISTEGTCACWNSVGQNCSVSTWDRTCTYSSSSVSAWNGLLSDGSNVVDEKKKTVKFSPLPDPLFPSIDSSKYTLLLKYGCNGVLQFGPSLLTLQMPNINAVSSTLENIVNSVFSCNSGWSNDLRRVLLQPYNPKAWLAMFSSVNNNNQKFSPEKWTVSPMQRIMSLFPVGSLNVEMPSTCTYSEYETKGCSFTYSNFVSLLGGEVKIHFHTSRCSAQAEGFPNFYAFCEGTLCNQILNGKVCRSDDDCGNSEFKCSNPLGGISRWYDFNLFDFIFMPYEKRCDKKIDNFFSNIAEGIDYVMGRSKKETNEFKFCLPSVFTVIDKAEQWALSSYTISGGSISLTGLTIYEGPKPSIISVFPPTGFSVSSAHAAGASFNWIASSTSSSSLTYTLTIVNTATGAQVVSIPSIRETSYILSSGLSPLTAYTASVVATIPSTSDSNQALQSSAAIIYFTTTAGSSGSSNSLPGGIGSIKVVIALSKVIPKDGKISLTLPSGYLISKSSRSAIVTTVMTKTSATNSITITDGNGKDISLSNVEINENTVIGVVAEEVSIGRVSIFLPQVKNPLIATTSVSFGAVSTADSTGAAIEEISISFPPGSTISGKGKEVCSLILLTIVATIFLLF